MGLISRLGAMIEFRHAVQDLKKAAKHEDEEGYQEKISGILARIDHASSQLGDPQKYRLGGQKFMLWNDYQSLNENMRDIADEAFPGSKTTSAEPKETSEMPAGTTEKISEHLTSMKEAVDELRNVADEAAKPKVDPKSVLEMGSKAVTKYEEGLSAIQKIRGGKGLTEGEAQFVSQNEFNKLKSGFRTLEGELRGLDAIKEQEEIKSLTSKLAELPNDDMNANQGTISKMWEIEGDIERAEERVTASPKFKREIEAIKDQYSKWQESHPKHMKLYEQGQAELSGFNAAAELENIREALALLDAKIDDGIIDEGAIAGLHGIQGHLQALTKAGKIDAFRGADKQHYDDWVRNHPNHAREAVKRKAQEL